MSNRDSIPARFSSEPQKTYPARFCTDCKDKISDSRVAYCESRGWNVTRCSDCSFLAKHQVPPKQ